ncbi:tetratricopeptide repeat protein [Streptomyces turgidiscabies]|uniref:Tetratricopeptide repeat protein n=2 Tax=Streptomyces TaxID=1883 RepID=L7FCM8_STRT8|nr:tetratricopeptide repeat protein [Streptomyces turgidiscabies]ELP69012.1 tetratricopeptide repeat protein [Streptomyces turgidiscabies Car8]MDX3495660.1 tetratricopeptide repeat protein [Streptomyces turgidiscabies]GAQ70351.1 regulatory protein AfsR [Streptomyces turgidiscabies]
MATEYEGDHIDLRGATVAGSLMAKAMCREHSSVPSALDALPAPAVGFTGRSAELQEILAVFDPTMCASEDGSKTAVIAAVSGLGGIGKTELAVQAGHAACAKGWFPGGVLFVDLHGYDEEPVKGDQALEALLWALGTEPKDVPAGLDVRAALYRSALADRARQRGAVLILADNASSPGQVRPLLPGGFSGHRLLVTSRDRLPQLGARLVALDELTPEEAYTLLDRALRIAYPADSRVADRPEEAARLAALCGHLPLALQIAAALLVVDRDKPVAELIAELAASRDVLGHLNDGERSVRAAFDLSYRRLIPEHARLLRLLALAPGSDASGEVVAALLGTDVPPLHALEELVRAHLVECGRTGGRRRWRLHDLVRAFGVGVSAGDAGLVEEGEVARERVLNFYYEWAQGADGWLRWFPGMSVPGRFAGRGEGLEWLDGERAGLVAAVGWAERERFAGAAVRLAGCLAEYLGWRRYFDDGVSVGRLALEAARSSEDRQGEAAAWNNLGRVLREASGATEETIEAHTCARDLYQAVGNKHGEAIAWGYLGIALEGVNRVGEAIIAHTHARELYLAVEDRQGEAAAWNNLGNALERADQFEEAIEALTRARDLFQVVGDRHREAQAWHNLGVALQDAGRTSEAFEAHGTALQVYREFEDWYWTGHVRHNLALMHASADRPVEARACWLQAADAYTMAGATAEADQARIWAKE